MAEAASKAPVHVPVVSHSQGSQAILQESTSAELIFAVVGHVGSGTSTVARQLKSLLEDPALKGGAFTTTIFKAREAIEAWAKNTGHELPKNSSNDLDFSTKLQDLGDKLRLETGDHSAVARALLTSIRTTRGKQRGVEVQPGKPVEPDAVRRAYIIDALRHPAEVHLLRSIYHNAFTLIGVVCDEEQRQQRLTKKFDNAGKKNAERFMSRDAESGADHGQRVSDAFHLSDYFLDNTVDRSNNVEWKVPEDLSRLVKIVTHSEVIRPLVSETAMFHAFGAKRSSACLSRQVGAAILDHAGNIVATGSNEVPRAGGGVYVDVEGPPVAEGRCAYLPNAYCSNTKEQNELIVEMVNAIRESLEASLTPEKFNELSLDSTALGDALRRTGVRRLLEFSRAVHAEMEAILSAGRSQANIKGGRLFVTTFPCHYCARHIVGSGLDEVQYIEPYPKSMALKLHKDSISAPSSTWRAPSKGGTTVLFRPFTGVGPSLFARAFLKDRELKDKKTGVMKIADPSWGTAFHQIRLSYAELEAKLEVPNGRV